jgi:hypothetical protein
MVRTAPSRRPAGVVKAGITKASTKAYPYGCFGCTRTFKQKKHLACHYGKTGKVRRKYDAGTLVAADLKKHPQCVYAQRQQAHGLASVRTIRNSGIRVLLHRPAASDAVFVNTSASKLIPEAIQDVRRIECDGLSQARVSEGIVAIQALPCVRGYVTDEKPAVRTKLYSFLLFLVYSMHATTRLSFRGLQLSELTCSIAVGVPGMLLLDDVVCFRTLYASLRSAFPQSADVSDCVLWILVAHMCVRPGIIEQIRNVVCIRVLRPTRENIADVITAMARRNGQVQSRMEAGQRSWRQIDVFGLASTQTFGTMNCGTHNLHKQLLKYDALRSIAENIAQLQYNPTFTDIVDCIGKAHVPCYAPSGYWTVHLARVFLPSYTGYDRIQTVTYTDKCIRTLYRMGSGASSLNELGIREVSAPDRIRRMTACVEKLGDVFGFRLQMDPAHLVLTACEAHRRDVYTGVFSRRSGL